MAKSNKSELMSCFWLCLFSSIFKDQQISSCW